MEDKKVKYSTFNAFLLNLLVLGLGLFILGHTMDGHSSSNLIASNKSKKASEDLFVKYKKLINDRP